VDNSRLAPSDIGRTADIFSLGQAIENIGGGGSCYPLLSRAYKLGGIAKRGRSLHLVPVRHRYARHRAARALLNQSTGLILTTSCKDVPPTDKTILGNSGTLCKTV